MPKPSLTFAIPRIEPDSLSLKATDPLGTQSLGDTK